MLALDISSLVQEILFLLFADLTALISAVIGPTYDHLLVPELATAALYPPVWTASPAPSNFLAPAGRFSTYLLGAVVDPVVGLLALGVALLYLLRSVGSRWRTQFDDLLPRLVLSVAAANFALPIAVAILGVGASLYPVVAGWDAGAWRQWVDLGGAGEIRFSWDNGVLAFVLALVEFALVFALVLALAARDAMLAVLLVLLPVLTLLWPFRPLSTIARRAWLLFAELAFLPCVMVVPLELAVGSPTAPLLVGYLGAALAAPFLLSVSGTHLMAIGFPSVGTSVQQASTRGLGQAPGAAAGYARPALQGLSRQGAVGAAAAGGIRAAGTAAAPLAPPLAVAELLGHGAARLASHIGGHAGPPRVPALRGGGPG